MAKKPKTLKEIAIELLEKYEASETTVICEYSTNIRHSVELLGKEVAKYRKMIDKAERKDENSSEKPNNCEAKNYCDDCLYTDTCDSKEFFYACTSKATISKMEQVDKDINVRSKDEPQTEYDKYREKIKAHDPHKDWYTERSE